MPGAAATVVPIVYVIKTYGYDRAFLWFGLGQGLVILVLSQFLKAPKPGEAPNGGAQSQPERARLHADGDAAARRSSGSSTSCSCWSRRAAWSSPRRWRRSPSDYKIASLPVNFLFISSTVLVMAGIVDNILNGLARPTFGWVSDHIGRENTMAIVFTVGAGAYWALGTIGNTPWMFIATAGPRLLHLGRDLQPLPGDLHRHLRIEVRDDQRRPALHRQRHGGVPGAGGELAAEPDRQLARGLRRGRRSPTCSSPPRRCFVVKPMRASAQRAALAAVPIEHRRQRREMISRIPAGDHARSTSAAVELTDAYATENARPGALVA